MVGIEVLSETDKYFIAKNMMIDLSSIEEKLNEPNIIEHKTDIEIAVSKFLSAIIAQKESGVPRDQFSFEDSEAEIFINDCANELSEKINNNEARWTLDSLRHAFASFASNGLHQLYTRQENESWYPKIVLTDILEPNDIDTLNEKFIIFRGCDRAELKSGKFGQSWSTNEQVARRFAFEHYESQDWYNQDNRVVLRATYCKRDVLFSNQTDYGEYEIAIKTACLKNVTQYT